jgi:hypothetical protein
MPLPTFSTRASNGTAPSPSTRPVKGQPLDDGADNDTPTDELTDGVRHVGVVAPQAVHPAHDKGVPLPESMSNNLFPSGRSRKPVLTPEIPWSAITSSKR